MRWRWKLTNFWSMYLGWIWKREQVEVDEPWHDVGGE